MHVYGVVCVYVGGMFIVCVYVCVRERVVYVVWGLCVVLCHGVVFEWWVCVLCTRGCSSMRIFWACEWCVWCVVLASVWDVCGA